jgi:peptidoglycan-N-acetylglucosamine deacetylase
MHLTWANLWTFTLGANFAVWAFSPEIRGSVSLILVLHIPVLLWGIFDIRSQFFGEVLIRNPEAGNVVALTFDDGPDPSITPAILDLLDEFGMKATFFVVARRAQQYPEIVRRAFASGHTIACHDLSHAPTGNFRLRGRMLREVGLAQQAIADIIGRKPLLYRPPVGLMNPHVLPVLATLGMRCVGWSRSAGDAGNRRRGALGMIPALAGSGETVLLHDVLPNATHGTALETALHRLVETIRAQHLDAVTVDRLFGLSPYA